MNPSLFSIIFYIVWSLITNVWTLFCYFSESEKYKAKEQTQGLWSKFQQGGTAGCKGWASSSRRVRVGYILRTIFHCFDIPTDNTQDCIPSSRRMTGAIRKEDAYDAVVQMRARPNSSIVSNVCRRTNYLSKNNRIPFNLWQWKIMECSRPICSLPDLKKLSLICVRYMPWQEMELVCLNKVNVITRCATWPFAFLLFLLHF